MKSKKDENKRKMIFSPAKPLIYLITEGTTTAANFAAKKGNTQIRLVKARSRKISLIQIREKKLAAQLVFEIARKPLKSAPIQTRKF